MIGDLIKILDTLMFLKKEQVQSRKDMFDEVFEPVFNDLLLIHGDYIKMFEHAKWLLPGYSKEGGWTAPGYFGQPDENSEEYKNRFKSAKEEIKRRRLEFEPIRTKVRAISKDLAGKKFPKEETKFIESVLAYFPNADPRSPDSSARNIIDYLDKHATDPYHVEIIFHTLIDRHKSFWSDVCEAYAALKIQISKLK